VFTGHTGEQISEWLRCRGGENIVQPRHLATVATQSGALFLVLKAECIAVCAPMWHGTQWMYHKPLHLIRSVQGLLPSSPSVSPSPDCLPLVSRLGCPGSTPGRGIPFPDCLLLFSRLDCPGSTHGRGIAFPDCLLLFSRLGCPGNTLGKGIPFPSCLLLFSKVGCLGSVHGSSIRLPSCLLRFGRLCCPGSRHASRASTASCLLLFSCLPSPSLAMMQAAVVPSNVKSVDSRIAMLDSHSARQCEGGPYTSSIGMPFGDGANISEDGVAAGPCTHALLTPAWHVDPCHASTLDV
jgi:hypothetical protein